MEYSILKKWNESDNIKVQNRASQTNPPNPQTAKKKIPTRRSKKEKATKRKIFRRLVSKGDSSESAEREV